MLSRHNSVSLSTRSIPSADAMYLNRSFSSADGTLSYEELFKKIDTSEDGFIGLEELSFLLSKLGLAGGAKQAEYWMKTIDKDGNGLIDFEEFVHFMTYARNVFLPVHRQPMAADAVFLGGSCNPTTWRKEISIPILQKAKVSYFNPQTDDWSPDQVAIEAAAKLRAKILLFVIDGETRAISSMIEATYLIASNRRMVLVINDIDEGRLIEDRQMVGRELKDLNRARAYLADVASQHNVTVYKSIMEATCHVVEWITELEKEGDEETGNVGTDGQEGHVDPEADVESPSFSPVPSPFPSPRSRESLPVGTATATAPVVPASGTGSQFFSPKSGPVVGATSTRERSVSATSPPLLSSTSDSKNPVTRKKSSPKDKPPLATADDHVSALVLPPPATAFLGTEALISANAEVTAITRSPPVNANADVTAITRSYPVSAPQLTQHPSTETSPGPITPPPPSTSPPVTPPLPISLPSKEENTNTKPRLTVAIPNSSPARISIGAPVTSGMWTGPPSPSPRSPRKSPFPWTKPVEIDAHGDARWRHLARLEPVRESAEQSPSVNSAIAAPDSLPFSRRHTDRKPSTKDEKDPSSHPGPGVPPIADAGAADVKKLIRLYEEKVHDVHTPLTPSGTHHTQPATAPPSSQGKISKQQQPPPLPLPSMPLPSMPPPNSHVRTQTHPLPLAFSVGTSTRKLKGPIGGMYPGGPFPFWQPPVSGLNSEPPSPSSRRRIPGSDKLHSRGLSGMRGAQLREMPPTHHHHHMHHASCCNSTDRSSGSGVGAESLVHQRSRSHGAALSSGLQSVNSAAEERLSSSPSLPTMSLSGTTEEGCCCVCCWASCFSCPPASSSTSAPGPSAGPSSSQGHSAQPLPSLFTTPRNSTSYFPIPPVGSFASLSSNMISLASATGERGSKSSLVTSAGAPAAGSLASTSTTLDHASTSSALPSTAAVVAGTESPATNSTATASTSSTSSAIRKKSDTSPRTSPLQRVTRLWVSPPSSPAQQKKFFVR